MIPSQFSDVAAVLDAAIANGGGLYRLPTPGKAVHWRQRAYNLRKALAKADTERKAGTAAPSTPYDALVLRILDSDRCAVRIEIRQPEGELTTFANEPVQPKATTDLAEDILLDEVEALVNKVGL